MEIEKIIDSTKAIILLILGAFLCVIGWLPMTHNSYIDFAKIHLAIKIFTSTLGLFSIYLSYIYFKKDLSDNGDNSNADEKMIIDTKRRKIIENYKPSLYVPLEKDFCDIATSSCSTNIFPHIFILGERVDQYEFIPKLGYKFNGKNMISVHSKHNFPSEGEERTFIFSVNPTSYPEKDTPMFFFSYGQRIKHECGNGMSNHDKSFGVFWGEPQPDEEIPNKYKGIGVRIFFYCEHCEKDRTSNNCDTEVIYIINKLNKPLIMAVAYDGENITFYVNGEEVYSGKYDLETSKSPYLNIGGFVHHNEEGAMIAKDLDYTMKGYIREFIMLRKNLPSSQIRNLTRSIQNIVEESSE